jgi:cytochrome b
MSPPTETRAAVRAWDLPTRLFHWTLVALIISGWVSYEYAEALGDVTLVWHRWNGLAVLVLIVWRLLWGVAGSSTARFSSFVRAPGAAAGYARSLVAGALPRYLGHNPLGAYMVLALLAAVAVQGSLGLFAVDDNDLTGGPLYRLVSEATNRWATRWHGWSFDYVILALAAVHITANALYGLVKREPLIRAMITGRKPAEDYEDAAEAAIVARPLLRASICLVIATALVAGAILALGGRLW